MSRNQITMTASPEDVFAVLDDADAYPGWVVGARRVRRVDPDWPSEGSAFHHAIGVPGAELHDYSKVIEREPPHRLVLEVRIRPTGVARVELDVDSGGGGGEQCVVTMRESPVAGPIRGVPGLVTEPLLHLRNALSLQRLRHEVERRARRAP